MSMLTLGGTEIPITYDSDVETDRREYGDFGPAWDGTVLVDIHSVREVSSQLQTPWMNGTQTATVFAALTATPPITAGGDLPGVGYSAVVRNIRRARRRFPDGLYTRFSFELHEI